MIANVVLTNSQWSIEQKRDMITLRIGEGDFHVEIPGIEPENAEKYAYALLEAVRRVKEYLANEKPAITH